MTVVRQTKHTEEDAGKARELESWAIRRPLRDPMGTGKSYLLRKEMTMVVVDEQPRPQHGTGPVAGLYDGICRGRC